MKTSIITYLDAFKKEIKVDHIFDIINWFDSVEIKEFLIRRISYSHNLEKVLLHGIEESNKKGYAHVSYELQKNLDDEQWIVDGVKQEGKAHISWRKDFLDELWILKDIQNHTKDYYDFYHLDYFQFLGGIIFIEFIIPLEFSFIKRSLIKNNIPLSNKGLFYLDDHISHDAISHLPDLLYGVNKDITKQEDIDNIIKWIEIGYKSKKQFYANLKM